VNGKRHLCAPVKKKPQPEVRRNLKMKQEATAVEKEKKAIIYLQKTLLQD